MPVLKDITIGKYVESDSPVHRLDPRTKFLGTVVLMTAVLIADGFAPLLAFSIFLIFTVALSKLPAAMIVRNLRPFIWLFFFTLAMHALMTPGSVLVELPLANAAISREGLYQGAFFTVRLSLVITTAALMTLTTAPVELTDGLERLLNPLRIVGFPAHEMAMLVTISLRFVPVLIEEAERLYKAQLARGADFGGNPIQRLRRLIPLLVPLFISAFGRADRLALAMESRCYRGGIERTNYRELRFHQGDARAAIAVIAVALFLIWLPRNLP